MSNITPLESLVASGTKLWLDSVDPDLVRSNRLLGASGATSNPIIISDLIKSGRFDSDLEHLLLERELSAEDAAWEMTDQVVHAAQQEFLSDWESSNGNDGYVSFELDPLLEDEGCQLSHEHRVAEYIRLGAKWSAGHDNRMIKVPATPAGLDALEELAAAGTTLNITLIFSQRQYESAREAIWKGAARRSSLDTFKSVYSIFVSRVDVYTQQNVPELSTEAQGLVGIVNAKRLWQSNQDYWSGRVTSLQQEIIFASTGTKSADDPPWKYVAALAGSDIQTNPPATNEAVQQSGIEFTRTVDQFPPDSVLDEIDTKVDNQVLEDQLMREGLKKFADPQKALIALLEEKKVALAAV